MHFYTNKSAQTGLPGNQEKWDEGWLPFSDEEEDEVDVVEVESES